MTKLDLEEYFRRQSYVYSDSQNSSISKFYAGKYVLVTGATGFLGKLTIEKLMRACPDLGGIFMLVRAKKGKDMHERLDEIFNEVIYEHLSKLQPKFRHKITPIRGDMILPGLGLSIEDKQLIIEKTNVIFHGAATVRFDEKLQQAVAINVRGTKDIMSIAKECQNLESFVYISTAFANCIVSSIDETTFTSTMEPERMIKICESTPPDILEKVTQDYLGEYPNTYAYTKGLAENMVVKHASGLPLCIFRPAVVISTWKEPTPVWTDNFYGPTGVVAACGIGLLRALQCDANMKAELVPADMVVNCMIAASYKTVLHHRQLPETGKETIDDISIYNYVSSVQKPLTWEKFAHYVREFGYHTPSVKSIWCYKYTAIKSRPLYLLYIFFVHTIPALLIDMIMFIIGKKVQMVKAYKKIHKFSDVISYFTVRSWHFTNQNVQNLWKELSEEDQKLFPFDMENFNWDDYFRYFALGLRTYIVHDDISTLPMAKKRMKRLILVDKILQVILIVVALKFLYDIVAYFLL